MNYTIFAYDFPHTKTKEFIVAIKLLGCKINCILAAPKIELNYPKPKIRISVKKNELIHPQNIAKIFDIPYFVVPHNSDECIDIIKERNAEIGIITGARILSKKVIDAFSTGIINFHPGLIPQNRGLDNLKWAIHKDIPQGVTTHFIDNRVDAGRIILQQQIPIFKDDTLFDIDQRLYETQLDLIKPTLDAIEGKYLDDFPLVTEGKPKSVMPNELEKGLPDKFEAYKLKLINKK
jgi:folate-dependent phosphoribosylglycinamide formyltransferase PurN